MQISFRNHDLIYHFSQISLLLNNILDFIFSPSFGQIWQWEWWRRYDGPSPGNEWNARTWYETQPETNGQEDEEASHNIHQSPATATQHEISKDSVFGATRESRPGGSFRANANPGKNPMTSPIWTFSWWCSLIAESEVHRSLISWTPLVWCCARAAKSFCTWNNLLFDVKLLIRRLLSFFSKCYKNYCSPTNANQWDGTTRVSFGL